MKYDFLGGLIQCFVIGDILEQRGHQIRTKATCVNKSDPSKLDHPVQLSWAHERLQVGNEDRVEDRAEDQLGLLTSVSF